MFRVAAFEKLERILRVRLGLIDKDLFNCSDRDSEGKVNVGCKACQPLVSGLTLLNPLPKGRSADARHAGRALGIDAGPNQTDDLVMHFPVVFKRRVAGWARVVRMWLDVDD